MSDDLEAAVRRVLAEQQKEKPDRHWFAWIIGIIAVAGGMGALVLLSFHPIPEGNKEALLLAIGIVLGWGGSVIASEFGSSPGGRAAASAFIRQQQGDQP